MVEDDKKLPGFYEAALASEYEFLTATGFGAAWYILQKRHMNAVTCNLHPGSVNGLELLKWISENLPGLLARNDAGEAAHDFTA